MSGIITPSGLVNELTVITDGDTLSEVNVPGEVFNRKIKKSVDKTYMQGTLPAEVAGIKNGTEQLNPRSFTSGRFDSQELVSGSLSVSGWYTIAETGTSSFRAVQAKFEINMLGGSRIEALSSNVLAPDNNSAKTHQNTNIEIIGRTSSVSGALRLRLAKSDSVAGAGSKVQAYCSISTTVVLRIQITNNLQSGSGFSLVTPYLDNTPTLPDGVTVGTFLEAGEELSFSDDTIDPLKVKKLSDDVLFATLYMPEIPKQGTGITITFPSTSFVIYDGTGASIALSSATTSNLTFTGKIINFRITSVAAFATLNSGPLTVEANGTGGKLTIT